MDPVELGERKKVGRNDPCPCGSGKKYKKCCVDAEQRLDGRRVVERNGQRLLVSAGLTDAQLAAADEFFAAKEAGRGPGADIAEYAAPLLDATDGSPEQTKKALDMAMAFWNLAVITGDQDRQRILEDTVMKAFEVEDEREHFRSLADDMIERHRAMFPELHRER